MAAVKFEYHHFPSVTLSRRDRDRDRAIGSEFSNNSTLVQCKIIRYSHRRAIIVQSVKWARGDAHLPPQNLDILLRLVPRQTVCQFVSQFACLRPGPTWPVERKLGPGCNLSIIFSFVDKLRNSQRLEAPILLFSRYWSYPLLHGSAGSNRRFSTFCIVSE